MVERDNRTVHARGTEGNAEIGVHLEREVQRGGAFGQLHNIALGREHKHVVAEHGGFAAADCLVKLHGLGETLFCFLISSLFVTPVRGDTVLGFAVHGIGAHLHFYAQLFRHAG